MTEIKNTERELQLFHLRLTVLGLLVFVCFGLLMARFVWLQVYKHDDYEGYLAKPLPESELISMCGSEMLSSINHKYIVHPNIGFCSGSYIKIAEDEELRNKVDGILTVLTYLFHDILASNIIPMILKMSTLISCASRFPSLFSASKI